MAGLTLTLFLFGLFLLWLARRRESEAGLPAGRVIYLDTRPLSRVEKTLHDPRLHLAGRPDYLVRQAGQVIPVEVKSASGLTAPYESHVLQLAAYCVLVEAAHGVRPSHGIVKYADRAFAVDYTPVLERALLDLLARMRACGANAPSRSHDSPERCQGCGFRQVCDERAE